MNIKPAFLYVDDDQRVVKAFKDTVRREWNLNYDILSNETFGTISVEGYDQFEQEIFGIITSNYERLECVFLDLDFSGAESAPEADKTGFLLGKAIRGQWPALPIIISTRFTESEIFRKGMIFDFDNICDANELIRMESDRFTGMLTLAKQKRSIFIDSVGDIPISYRLGRHKYFKHVDIDFDIDKFAFVAMPFDKELVREDVWKLGIEAACKTIKLDVVRVDEELRSLGIVDKIAHLIFKSKIVIADLTGWNSNVLYELGIAHTCDKPCILLIQRKLDLLLPFDVRHLKTIIYNDQDLSDLQDQLHNSLLAWIESNNM